MSVVVDVDIRFELINRNNCHVRFGNEWALNMNVAESGWWTITTWDKKPIKEAADDAVQSALKAIHAWKSRSQIVEKLKEHEYEY